MALLVSGGAGYKLYTSDADVEDNIYDVLATVGLEYGIDDFTIRPSVSAGWTNFTKATVTEGGVTTVVSEGAFSDEYMVYGGLAIGWEK